jgi:hypothetical protein
MPNDSAQFSACSLLIASPSEGQEIDCKMQSNYRVAAPLTPEALADYFVRYLFEEYHGTRHVRRIASWVGFVVKGTERVVGTNFQRRHARQIGFDYHGRQFKVRYVHRTGVKKIVVARAETARHVKITAIVDRRLQVIAES